MNTPDQPAHEFLAGQLSLLDRMAHSLQCAQSAMLTGDLPALQAHTTEQMELCQTLKRERVRAASLSESRGSTGVLHSSEIQTLETQVRMMEDRVRQLNRVHACLLARAQKALAIFRHILARECLTYALDGTSTGSRTGGE